MVDHIRDNRKFKPGQSYTNRDRVNRTTKTISGYSKHKRRRKFFVNQNNRRRYIYREDKEGERRIIQEMEESSNTVAVATCSLTPITPFQFV